MALTSHALQPVGRRRRRSGAALSASRESIRGQENDLIVMRLEARFGSSRFVHNVLRRPARSILLQSKLWKHQIIASCFRKGEDSADVCGLYAKLLHISLTYEDVRAPSKF